MPQHLLTEADIEIFKGDREGGGGGGGWGVGSFAAQFLLFDIRMTQEISEEKLGTANS